MDLNDFGSKLIQQLSRIANSAESMEQALKSGKSAGTATAANNQAPSETAAEKKARLAAEKKASDAAAAAASAPKADRAAVNKALVELKDTVSKEAAQAVYQQYGYTAMSKIEEKDFDAVKADAEAALEAAKSTNVDDANDDDL
jgi:hypothetical protein